MKTRDLSKIPSRDLDAISRITAEAGVDPTSCYQCGKCSAGCPMSESMDMKPQRVMRSLQLGLIEPVLEAKGPWLCAGCEVCSARCPQGIDIASLMQEVRRASKAAGHSPAPDSDAFEEIFIGNIRSCGRSAESRLAMRYNLATRHFLQDAAGAPRMFARGMISLRVDAAKDRKAIERLVDRCLGEKGA